jgi:hypothetical protein
MLATVMYIAMSLVTASVEAEQAPPVSVRAWVSTAGPYGESWELTIDPKGTASLEIGYMLNPLGRISGEFHLTLEALDTIRKAIANERFFELPPNIAPETVPIHAPDLKLTVTISDRTHEVRLYDPEELPADPRVKRFLAVWNQAFASVPLKPRW